MAKKKHPPIPMAVAGLGRIGWRFHCARIAANPQFQLAAVCDPEPARRREAQETYGCRTYEDFDAMLGHEGLRAVAIATPNHLHKAQALAAFRKGLHVLLEKPMAVDAGEARAILRAAKRVDRVLTVYQPHRASAYLQHILHIVGQGRIGQVYQVRIGRFHWVRRNDWQSLLRYGGGMLNNYGAHAIDVALAITGFDYRDVFCTMRRVATVGDAEDAVKIVYTTKTGKTADIEINMGSPLNPYFLEVYGSLGAISATTKEIQLKYITPSQLKAKAVQDNLASADRQYPSDKIEFREKTLPVADKYQVDYYRNFADAILGQGKLLVPPEQSVAVMTLMADCRRRAGDILESRFIQG